MAPWPHLPALQDRSKGGTGVCGAPDPVGEEADSGLRLFMCNFLFLASIYHYPKADPISSENCKTEAKENPRTHELRAPQTVIQEQ